jgi:hypothetical protein
MADMYRYVRVELSRRSPLSKDDYTNQFLAWATEFLSDEFVNIVQGKESIAQACWVECIGRSQLVRFMNIVVGSQGDEQALRKRVEEGYRELSKKPLLNRLQEWRSSKLKKELKKKAVREEREATEAARRDKETIHHNQEAFKCSRETEHTEEQSKGLEAQTSITSKGNTKVVETLEAIKPALELDMIVAECGNEVTIERQDSPPIHGRLLEGEPEEELVQC